MKDVCIKCNKGRTSGTNRLPGRTGSPDSHWAFRLIDAFNPIEGVQIVYDNDDQPTVQISRHLQQTDPAKYQQVMQFIKSNFEETTGDFYREDESGYQIVLSECAKCEGHSECVSVWTGGNAVIGQLIKCHALAAGGGSKLL